MSGKPTSRGSHGNTQRGACKPPAKLSGMPKKEIKKSVNDNNYYLGSAKQASDYEMTTEFLINYIIKTFEYGNDIGQALTELEYPDHDSWRPTMQQSTYLGNDLDDEAQRAFENKQFEIKFKSEFDDFRIRKRTLDSNKPKAYAFLWEHCTKGMKNKIKSQTNYATIQQDPIELLKAIKEHALNYQEQRYKHTIVFDAMTTRFGTKQQDNESLQDYTK
jgi:hypothetical protein